MHAVILHALVIQPKAAGVWLSVAVAMMLGFDAGGDAQILPDGPACSLVFLLLQAVFGGDFG